MGKIRINNMKFYTYNGALSEERVLGQPIEIDLTLVLPLEDAGRSDDLQQTVSYADVYEVIKNYIAKHSFNLIEALAYGILDTLEAHYQPALDKIVIKIRKYHVPIDGIFDNIEIEMERII